MPRPERGFALLIVLWSLVLLALLTTELTATGRSEVQMAGNVRSAAMLEAATDGLVYEVIFRLIGGAGLNGPAMRWTEAAGGGEGVIELTNLAGTINPNTASEPRLRSLLQTLGQSPQAATGLAAAIADWRSPGDRPRPSGAKLAQYQAAGLGYGPPGEPFESVAELAGVLGMTPDLLARLLPHLSVFYPGDPVAAYADPVVASILPPANASEPGAPDGDVYARIEARLRRKDGSAFNRQAEVWVGRGPRAGQYLVLRWATLAAS